MSKRHRPSAGTSSSEQDLPMTAADLGTAAAPGRVPLREQIAACVARWQIQLPEHGAVSLHEMHDLQWETNDMDDASGADHHTEWRNWNQAEGAAQSSGHSSGQAASGHMHSAWSSTGSERGLGAPVSAGGESALWSRAVVFARLRSIGGDIPLDSALLCHLPGAASAKACSGDRKPSATKRPRSKID